MKNESGAAEREVKRKHGGEVHIKHRSKFMFTYKTEYLQITHTQPTSQQPAAILVQNTAAKSRLCEQQKNRTALERWAAACSAIEKSRNYTSMYVPEQQPSSMDSSARLFHPSTNLTNNDRRRDRVRRVQGAAPHSVACLTRRSNRVALEIAPPRKIFAQAAIEVQCGCSRHYATADRQRGSPFFFCCTSWATREKTKTTCRHPTRSQTQYKTHLVTALLGGRGAVSGDGRDLGGGVPWLLRL